MSRRVVLIRHAMPDLPLGERWCVGGRTDLPLGRLGRMQASLLPYADALRGIETVYCSTLLRARQTALPLCAAPRTVSGVQEQDMGVWDGLSFREIRARYPELYAAREDDPSLLPAGAESGQAVEKRMRRAILECLRQSAGDIAIVSHKGAIASLTGRRAALDYTSMAVLRFEGDTLLDTQLVPPPRPAMSDELCLLLLRAAANDEALCQHCMAVAALADELCAALAEKGVLLDRALVRHGALLHDLARGEADHAARGARLLQALGYGELAPIVEQHHDWDGARLDEAALVYLADKAVRGAQRVPIDERFAASLSKCTTSQARAAHARRYAAAKRLQSELEELLGRDILSDKSGG